MAGSFVHHSKNMTISSNTVPRVGHPVVESDLGESDVPNQPSQYMCNPPVLTCKQASKLEIHNPELTDEYIYDLLLLSFVISLVTIKLTFLSFSMFS